MGTSITTCGRPGMSISGSGDVSFSYKTKAGATTATTERELLDAAKNSARRDAKLQFSCSNGSCLDRHADLPSFTVAMSVQRGFWGWLWNLLGGKGWKAVASYTFTANVWCEPLPDTLRPPESSG